LLEASAVRLRRLTQHCRREGARGKPVVDLLAPTDDDYFVLKAKHSGFFSTTLVVLLDYLSAETLVLTGVAGNICVLFTANDASMRDYRLIVPADCVASETRREDCQAPGIMHMLLKADITPSTRLQLGRLAGRGIAWLAPGGASRRTTQSRSSRTRRG
jgi:nicotinamidase-related amidase